MKKSFLLILLFTLSILKVSAITALVSNAVFYIQDSTNKNSWQPFVETSWEIIPHSLHYKTDANNEIYGKIFIEIIYSKNDSIVGQDHFVYSTMPQKSVAEINSHKILDLRRYYLPVGKISMNLKIIDLLDTTNVFNTTDSFVVAQPADKAFFSGIQLLDTILTAGAPDVFSKNNVLQIPLNGSFLDDDKRFLHYYSELYQSTILKDFEGPLVQKVFISKTKLGAPMRLFYATDTLMPDNIKLVSGSFDISYLPSGNYYLNALIEDKYHNTLASTALFFQRLNKHPASEDAIKKKMADTGTEKVRVVDLEKTFVTKFTMSQLKAVLQMLLPVANNSQTQTINGFLERPDDTYMRYFIFNYFSSINSANPAAAWKEYSQKVIDVNKMFKEAGKAGYVADRGFRYLRYGKPTDVINAENEPGALPYEIWQYDVLDLGNHNTMNNALFLFYKPNPAVEDFVLLHSNVTGEAHNKNWRNQLYTNRGVDGMRTNRAEEYFGTER